MQWMRHPEIELPAQFAEAAVPAWEARGWIRCDPPPEVNPVTAHQIPEPEQPVTPAEVADEPEED